MLFNSKSLDTTEMSRNINDSSLANLKHFEGKWRHGATRTIRVPIALVDGVLAFARQLDKSESLDTGEDTAKQPCVQTKQSNSGQTSKSPDTSDILRAADLLNRLKAKNKKSKATLSDVEAILAMLEK
jgi:hypothetical protein